LYINLFSFLFRVQRYVFFLQIFEAKRSKCSIIQSKEPITGGFFEISLFFGNLSGPKNKSHNYAASGVLF